MRRRNLVLVLGGAMASGALIALAEASVRPARIGVLSNRPREGSPASIVFARLAELGYSDGHNLTVFYQDFSKQRIQPSVGATLLVREGVDLIWASGGREMLEAALGASPTTPIVISAVNYDPIESGYVASLAHPGANITGVILRSLDIIPKQLEFLRELVPGSTRLGVLWDEYTGDEFTAATEASKTVRLQLHSAELKLETRAVERGDPSGDIEAAFQQLARSRPHMLLVLSSGVFQFHRDQIAALALHHRMPSMFKFPDYVRSGGLVSYGVNRTAIYRQLTDQILKILNGTTPADIPIERADKFELVINLKTAKELGLTVAQSLLARADEVIE
jgi:putative ABC transport system substrate-binding protein